MAINQPMPWCDKCQCYHHYTAEHIGPKVGAEILPDSYDRPEEIPDEPRCDCGHLFEICNHPNCPCGGDDERIGEPGGMNFPYEFKWDGGEAIIYAASEQQAVWIFKTCNVDEQGGCAWPVSIRLMSDNE